MCEGVPIFSNNKKALHGVGTTSHSDAAKALKIDEDKFLKSEYHWWDKKFVADHYDGTGLEILIKNKVNPDKAEKVARLHVKKYLSKQRQIVSWLKKTPTEWSKLMEPKMYKLAKLVNPKLVIYQNKIKKFQKQSIEKFNPYQATKLPSLKTIKSKFPKKIWDQVRDQVGDQVGDQVWNQVWNQEHATSYWAIKVVLGLPIKHWFFDFLKLGIMVVFVQGEMKVFGKKGKFLGEYKQSDL